MKQFLVTVPRNLMGCFNGRRIVWHVIAILLTFILVMSGFDWRWFLATRNPALRAWMWSAVGIGGLLPLALPLFLLAVGFIIGNARTMLTGWAVGQAELLGAFVAAAYKAFTGRAHPAHDIGTDISHVFHFGFLRGGVFWGWPSSHTTIAFAMAVTIFTLCPKQRWLGFMAILYACYVGIGVSMTIHWFSDFAAGAIIGSVIGAVVGKGFVSEKNSTEGNEVIHRGLRGASGGSPRPQLNNSGNRIRKQRIPLCKLPPSFSFVKISAEVSILPNPVAFFPVFRTVRL